MIIDQFKYFLVFVFTALLASCSYNDLTDLWPSGDDIEEVDVQILLFDDLIKKYQIEEVKYLLIDTEGFDYKIIKSIDFKKTKINKIKFEYKHLDDTFKYEVKLLELRNKFHKLIYKEIDFDNENITFEKNL